MDKKAQTKKNLLFAVPSLLNSPLPGMENTFFVFFLTNVALLPTAAMTMVSSLGATLIAFSSLLCGVIMQKVSFKKGKYRPWLIPCSIAVIIGRFMQFTSVKGSEGFLGAWFLIGYVLCNFAYTFTSTSYSALLPVIAVDPESRVQVSSWRTVASNIGGLLFNSTAVALIAFFGKGSESRGYSIVGNITGVFVLLGSILLLYVTKDVPDNAVTQDSASVEDNSKVSIWEMLKYTFANKCTILFLLAMWLKVASSIMVAMTMAYYYTYVAGNMALLTVYLSITSFLSIFGAFITPFVSKLFKGPRNTYAGALFCYCGVLLLGFLFKTNVLVVTILLSLNQIFWAVYMSAEMPLFIGVIDYTENKTGKDLRAFMMAVNTFAIKLGIVIATATIGFGLQAIGFEATAVTDKAVAGIPIVVMILPAIYALIGGIFAKLLPLSNEQMEKLHNENEERKLAK